jgi:hypothetical protein
MWSLQVQPQVDKIRIKNILFQQDATTIMDVQMGSQQSLPDLPTTAMDIDCSGVGVEQSGSLRPSKSLSGK